MGKFLILSFSAMFFTTAGYFMNEYEQWIHPNLRYGEDIVCVSDTDLRYFRRYQAWNLAKEIIKIQLVLDYIIKNNPNLKLPTQEDIENFEVTSRGISTDNLSGVGYYQWEHPTKDPDDE